LVRGLDECESSEIGSIGKGSASTLFSLVDGIAPFFKAIRTMGSSQKSWEDLGQQERLPLLRAGQMDCIFDVRWGKWVENREKTRQPSLGSRCVFEEIDDPGWMGKKESVSRLENPPGNLARQIQESAKLAKTAKLGLCETLDVPLSIRIGPPAYSSKTLIILICPPSKKKPLCIEEKINRDSSMAPKVSF
jgi:hypothetical protein